MQVICKEGDVGDNGPHLFSSVDKQAMSVPLNPESI